ncbi:MAG TPA: ATP-binding protein [Candidatus Babeliales bacterium]|nr:ATP-binding protein [Candidatus Babeliales bacterium]
MSKEEYIYLHNKNNQTTWESLTGNTCTLSDLDRNRIKEVVRMTVYEKRMPEPAISESIPDILKKLHLTIDGKLTNAAVILFAKKEDKQFLQCNMKMARFRGTDKSEFFDTKSFRGNAFDIYDKAMDFLVFSLPVAARIEPNNPIRVESPAIPYKALREAVTNAIIHRDYSQAGGSISIAIYDDRVNISNTGTLPKGVALNQLSKEHQSILRNPLIAQVFYLCGKIEKWGRGTVEMINDCKKVGNPPPKYEEIGGGFSLTLPLKEHISSIKKQKPAEVDLNALTSRQKKIIQVLGQGPLTTAEIIRKMRLTITNRTIQLDLLRLKELGFIKSTGKARFTMWSLA